MATQPTTEFLQLQQIVAGRFSIERELGRGGMGVVFLARDVALDRPVAIKLLPPVLAVQAVLRERFLREARTAAKLSHPNIVPIHIVEEHGDIVFFVMTYVDGETLGQRVRRAGPLTPSQTTRLVQEVAWALAYAHGRGVVHRDVKPDNILIDKDSGRGMVTDFGIARVAEAGTMSGAGEIVGTAHYMSPEQAMGEEVDGRSDLFSLGVTAFYALTGTLPFEGKNLPAIVTRIVNDPAPQLATLRPGIPGALADAVERCLEKKAEQRFASGEELALAVGTVVTPAEVAPQIRYLVRSFRSLDATVGVLLFAGFFGRSAWMTLWRSDPGEVWGVAALLAVMAGAGAYSVVHATRRVISAGLGPDDVQRAYDREVAAKDEEVRASFTRVPAEQAARRGKLWIRFGHVAAAIGIAGTIATDAFGVRAFGGAMFGLSAVSFVLAVLAYFTGFAMKRQIGTTHGGMAPPGMGLTERLLGTGFVDWLFKVSGIGMNVPTQNLPPAQERTEVMIASAVDEVFRGLSSDLRGRFANVSGVARRLELAAAQLRQRDADLDQRTGDADAANQRRIIRERLATTVAALENLRLDVLRLAGGSGSADDLTADLKHAAEIGAGVDAILYGQAEVRSALANSK